MKHPAGHGIGDTLLGEAVFQQIRLPVGAVQHRDIRKAADAGLGFAGRFLRIQHIDAAHQPVDFLGDEQRLRKGILRLQQPHRLAAFPLRLQPPLLSVRRYHRQGAAQDLRRGAVILRQADQPQGGKIGGQPIEAAGVGASEAIDRLIGIADDKEAFAAPAPSSDQPVLQVVDILEFIHQEMGEGDGAPPPFLHPVKDIQQQIIVIPRAETPLKPAIGIVRRRRHPLRRIGAAAPFLIRETPSSSRRGEPV